MTRCYDSPRRQAQARETWCRILTAATDLFVERGYAATSMAAIAAAAEVAPQTVHATFGTKAALLGAAVDVAMAGDDEPVAIVDRPETQAVLAARSASEAAAGFGRNVTALLARAGRLIHAADAAPDPDGELDALRRAGHRARLADMRRVAAAFADAGFLRDGIDAALAADILWTLASPDAFAAFTGTLGWSTARYERWLVASIERALFA